MADGSKRRYDTKSPEKILDAAEALIAEFGVRGVTFKQIAVAAGHANKSGVQYHFGDMPSLVNAILLRRHREVEAHRARLYEDIERAGRLETIESCLQIFFLPIVQVKDAQGGHVFAKFSLQYRVGMQHDEGVIHPGYEVTETLISQKVRLVLKNILWFIPDETVDMRILQAFGMFLVSVLEYDSAVSHGGNVRPWDEFLDDIFGVMSAAVKAPLPPR